MSIMSQPEYKSAFERQKRQEAVSDLAEKYLDAELAKGARFSEGLCDQAWHKADQEVAQ